MTGKYLEGSDFGQLPKSRPGVTLGLGLNNIGLLVKACGYVSQTGVGYFEMDDGSEPVRVDASRLTFIPALNSQVVITGISTIYKPDARRKRQLLPRDDNDVTVVSTQ